jgi:hypothetical protein
MIAKRHELKKTKIGLDGTNWKTSKSGLVRCQQCSIMLLVVSSDSLLQFVNSPILTQIAFQNLPRLNSWQWSRSHDYIEPSNISTTVGENIKSSQTSN